MTAAHAVGTIVGVPVGPFAFLGAAAVAYGLTRVARRGIRPRGIDTALSREELRALFVRETRRLAWRVVDEGEPLVVEAFWRLPVPERIELTTAPGRRGRTRAWVEVTSYVGREQGVALRASDIWWRLDAFLLALAERDPTAVVKG